MSDIDDIGSVHSKSADSGDEHEHGASGSEAVKYPMKVMYCGVCGLPPEYCEFDAKMFESCKPWINQHCPWIYPDLFEITEKTDELIISDNLDAPASSSVAKKASGKKKAGEAEVVISLATKKGKKSATVVLGADLFNIKLADLSKICKKKYSCGVSVSSDASNRDIVEIQGDRREEVAELLRDDFNVDAGRIFIMEDKKTKRKAFD
eukprot:CAMPEP_0184700344 /NCGR_PEP_ID=MMETSP0313-20130426/12240_1 /TAXON_ID=2792 /ORGANISM="Porphyridium aerugineum, Strain SAG 1380-2" /LENGTH=206 /DNA_ID=CAMNT_0027159957 /DNA_START=70 /DNA_END=690 /DNA_ORIENTATION=+